MKPVIAVFPEDPDVTIPSMIIEERFDTFIMSLYRISFEDGDPEIVEPELKYIHEVWLRIYKDNNPNHLQTWLYDSRQVSQAFNELFRGLHEYRGNWIRRTRGGRVVAYNYRTLTDVLLSELGARAFRLKPQDLKLLMHPNSTKQQELIAEWIEDWNPNLFATEAGPIQWRENVGGQL